MPQKHPQSESLVPMKEAIGDCIQAWAYVELKALLLLRIALGINFLLADTLWSSIKSFEARMTVTRNLTKAAFSERPFWKDAQFVDQYTMRAFRRRNQVAHGTLINDLSTKGVPVIEPFFALTQSGGRLTETDVREIAEDFRDLDEAYTWIIRQVKSPKAKLPLPEMPVPELILRLRREEAQRQEAQRRQQKDLALVKRLRKAGKWPPPEK